MRRHFLAVAGAAGLLLVATGAPLQAYEYQQILASPWPAWKAVRAPELVAYDGRYGPGTIVISTEERRLYYIPPGNRAVKYGMGGRPPRFEWSGVSSGCVCMTNEDVVDLYDRVKVGTRVVVLR
ncbi:MAG TPA: L,D-transpeptidase family protein [Methylocella sp.]|jgi:lipoprotein-anchoring transpeptidase ErfK/SrfK|nr:L,D-transpeptidase family protein [Methylocella sp.]